MSPVATGWDPTKDRLLSGLTITAEGVKVGPCLVTGKIGQGGMGAVYRAWHTMLNLEVAVKILPFHLVDDNQAYVQRFQREAQAAAVVSHQNLVRVFEMGCEKEIYFLILEFVNGESAHARLARKKTLTEAEALRIIRDATYGLGAAHAKNIIHRDVKPDNILVGADGTIKLADLGLAKIADADFAMTLSNVAMGTPQFMPPEQIINSKAVTYASDIWAMGISLYYLLTAQYPFNAENLMGLLNIINEKTPDISIARPGTSLATKAVIDRCLQKEPAQRYKSAADLIAGIDAALSDTTTAVDLTVPADNCLSSKLGPYTPGLLSPGQSNDGSSSPGSDAPTILGQGRVSSRPGATPSEGSYTSTLRLPPKGSPTPPLATGADLNAPVSTSAQTAVGQPAAATLITGATTLYAPGGKSRLWLVLLALAIVLPITGYALYWGFKVKPYDDAVAAAREFETKNDFANAAAAWKSAQNLTPTAEATEHATRNEKLAGILAEIHKAESNKDWKTLHERCDAFLAAMPGYTPVQDISKAGARAAQLGDILTEVDALLAKFQKASSWDSSNQAWTLKKKVVAALAEFPDNRPLKRAYAIAAVHHSDLADLDKALQWLDEALATPGLDVTEKTELEDLRKSTAENRAYEYTRKTVVEPLEAANKAATDRLQAMVNNLEDPQKAKAEALAFLTKIEPTLATDADDRAKYIEEAHTTFEKEFIRQAQQLSQTAQRKKEFTIARDALALVIDQIDDYNKNLAVHALAMLKLMALTKTLQAQPLGAFSGFEKDGNGVVVAPENLPAPDMRQLRILQVIDKDSVIALVDGRFYLTTLEFKQWKQVTNFAFDQNSLGLSPDLRLAVALYPARLEQGKTIPPDGQTLVMHEQAGDDRPWIHMLVTATQPDFHFNAEGTSLLMIGHAPGKTGDLLYSINTTEFLNAWEFDERGMQVLKTAAAGEHFRNPIWLPDGNALVYAVYTDATEQVFKLEVKTGKTTKLLAMEAGTGASLGATAEGQIAVDPTGKLLAASDPVRKRIVVVQTADGKVAAEIAAADTNAAQTGGGLYWSTDGKWLVYKALDADAPVFKRLGVQRK